MLWVVGEGSEVSFFILRETYISNLRTLLSLKSLIKKSSLWVVLESHFSVQLRPKPSWAKKQLRKLRQHKKLRRTNNEVKISSQIPLKNEDHFATYSAFRHFSYLHLAWLERGIFSLTIFTCCRRFLDFQVWFPFVILPSKRSNFTPDPILLIDISL